MGIPWALRDRVGQNVRNTKQFLTDRNKSVCIDLTGKTWDKICPKISPSILVQPNQRYGCKDEVQCLDDVMILLGYIWDAFGILLGYFWDTFRILLRYFWEILGIILG